MKCRGISKKIETTALLILKQSPEICAQAKLKHR